MQERVMRSYKYQLERLNKAGSKPYLGWTIKFGNQVDQNIDESENFRPLLKKSNTGKRTTELTEPKKLENHIHFDQQIQRERPKQNLAHVLNLTYST